MKILLGASIGLLTAVSTAQIPMSNYVRAFNSSLTRGFYFQAPASFTVTHLQVPDELKKGKYLVALYKLTAAPPAFSNRVNVKPVFYAENVNSANRVPAGNVPYKKGEWLAVLGAAGNPSGTITNSYGAAANKSLLCGLPITLNRCGVQANIGVAKGVGTGTGGMWSENTGPIARVRIWIRSGSDSVKYCMTSTTELFVPDPNTTAIGNKASVVVKAAIVNRGTLIGVGINRASVAVPGFAGRLCIGKIVAVFPMPPSVAQGTVHPFGTIPNLKALIGTKLRLQAALDRIGTGLIPLSNGLELTIGN